MTYVESSFAQRGGLGIAQIINSGGGQPVAADRRSRSASRSTASRSPGQGNDLTLDLNSLYKATAPGAYPIALATYEVVCSNYADDQTAAGGPGVPADRGVARGPAGAAGRGLRPAARRSSSSG